MRICVNASVPIAAVCVSSEYYSTVYGSGMTLLTFTLRCLQ